LRHIRRFFVHFFAGFPVPRLIAEKNKQIQSLQRQVAGLKAEMVEERTYHRGLLNSVLLKNYMKAVGVEDAPSAPPLDTSKPIDFDEWAKQDEDAEIEERAWNAANDDLEFTIVKEAASFDPKYRPVLERAIQIRDERSRTS
jgi:hypothetical protein